MCEESLEPIWLAVSISRPQPKLTACLSFPFLLYIPRRIILLIFLNHPTVQPNTRPVLEALAVLSISLIFLFGSVVIFVVVYAGSHFSLLVPIQ